MELIKIEERNGEQLVSARELHQFLEVKTKFIDWFNRMVEYGFQENVDYIKKNELTQKKEGSRVVNREQTDYIIKLPMAKELSMIQRNEKGKQAREYFIKCEEAWNSEDMILARALQIQNKKVLGYKEQIKVLENKLEEQKPKVIFAESVESSKTSILIGDLAKLIKQNGIDMGQKRMFNWLRENGYLIKSGRTDYNMPTQKSMEMKLFEIKETAITHSDGHITINKTVKVTGKGQIYFINKFVKVA